MKTTKSKQTENEWKELVGKRLLLTDKITLISIDEFTLLELSPSGDVGKFRNEIAGTVFWSKLNEFKLLDVLPSNEQQASDRGYKIKRK